MTRHTHTLTHLPEDQDSEFTVIKPTYNVTAHQISNAKFKHRLNAYCQLLNLSLKKVKVVQSCSTLCDPMDYTVHGILQARIPEWVAFPFSRGSSQPRDQTQVSHIAGGFFTSWATREAQKYCSGQPIPSPVGSDSGIKLGSPALHADFLPAKLLGKPQILIVNDISDKELILRTYKQLL